MSVTLEEIGKMVGLQLGRSKVGADEHIVEDLGAESADVVNIVAAVEERFEILIEDREIPDVLTVRDLFVLVRDRVGS